MSDQSFPFTPYKGLTSYAEEDAPYFFGREVVVNNIVARVQGWPLTLLYGASGVGKSSVLHAGVVHEFRRQAQRRREEGEPPEYCVVLFNSWSDDPVPALLGAVRRAVAQNFEGKALTPAAPSLAATLRAWSREIGCDLIVILDQFEEYFTYHSQEDGPGKLPQELSRAVNDADRRANFLISIREDALAKLDSFQHFTPNLLNQALHLRALDPEEAREAIEKPIGKFNSLSGEAPVGIEPELVDAILRDAQGGLLEEGAAGAAQPAGRRAHVEAPYLQQIMTRLWHEEARTGLLRLSTYERLGRAGEIVRTHLGKTIAKLDEGEQETAARIFRYLVTPSGTKIAQSAEDIAEYARLPQEDVSRVLDKLSARDILILRAVAPPPDEPGVTRYEIFHDVLAAPITTWWKEYEARERESAEEERKRLEAEEEAQRRHYEAAQQQQEAKARRLRRRMIGAGVLVAFLSIATGTSWAFWGKARNSEARALKSEASARESEANALAALVEAKDSSGRAEAALKEAKLQRTEADNAKEEAEKERDRAKQSLKAEQKAKAEADKQKNIALAALEKAGREQAAAEKARELAADERDRAIAAEKAARDAEAALTVSLDNEKVARQQAEDNYNELLLVSKVAEAQRKRANEEEQQRIKIDREGAAYALTTLRKHTGEVHTAAFRPEQHIAVTAGDEGNVLIWDTSDPLLHNFKEISAAPRPAGASPSTPAAPAAAPPSPSIIPASLSPSPAEATTTKSPTPTPTPVVAAISNGVGELVVTARGNNAVVWNRGLDWKQKAEQLYELSGHTGQINSITFSQDNRFVLSAGGDGKVLVWELGRCVAGQPCQARPIGADGKAAVLDAEFNPKDPYAVVTASEDGTAHITQWGLCETVGTCRDIVLQGHERGKAVNSASFSPDGQFVVTTGDDGAAIVWRSDSGKRVRVLREFNGVLVSRTALLTGFIRTRRIYKRPYAFRSAAFLPERALDEHGKPYLYVVTVGDSQEVRVWDVRTGTVVRSMSGHLAFVRSVGLTPEGKYIVTAGKDRTARIWDPCKGYDPRVQPDSKEGGAVKKFYNVYCAAMSNVKEPPPEPPAEEKEKEKDKKRDAVLTFLPPALYPPAAGSRFGLWQ